MSDDDVRVQIGTTPTPGTVPVGEVLGSVSEALGRARGWPAQLRPGTGGTVALWELLASCAAMDLAVARAVEPHLDALAILDQAGLAPGALGLRDDSTWGVYAAEGPGPGLTARETADGSWVLDGVKPWCSLAGELDAALVTGRLADEPDTRVMLAVDLRARGVASLEQGWYARGLAEIPSTPLRFDAVPAALVRRGDWYLERPGFWWGGLGVAACWYGGAVAIARRVHTEAHRKPEDRLLTMHLGALDERLHAARLVLADAAASVDASGASTGGGREPELPADRQRGRLLAKRVRAVVARTCEDVLRTAAHALGPGPLTQEADHAKRVADLEVYVRQQHAERDDASLGGALAGADRAPW
ncbi:acyl-CoA dehydrogenase [Cellulomonas sp. JH27-2]|uniref:acyl-CoA dehydrogenase n=1 Tax=Cellulomonas sp. JH27-2 TaxID=2774139 RepID=UPI0017832E11|nr:acyl-CoA dehydrogenase [Cellulomonas sp. JH27-2]MBD8058672.1 acyl-CoA dehydrogenase [Cellulomonas sp. JH27-2]